MQIKSQIEKYINIFSKDKTQNQAMRLALLLTLIIWMILFVVLAVSPGWNQKKKYKTIRISLAPLEEVRKEEKNPLEQKTIGKTKAAEPAKREEAQKKVDVKKTVQAEKKSQPAKQPVQEAKKANIKYGKSVDELLEAQNSVSKKKTFDWDSTLQEYCAANCTDSISPDLIKKIMKINLYTKWQNVGGQIIPEEKISQLFEKIKAEEIKTWEGVHEFYKACQSEYLGYKTRYAIFVLEELYSTKIGDFSRDIFKDIVNDVTVVSDEMYSSSVSSREKDE